VLKACLISILEGIGEAKCYAGVLIIICSSSAPRGGQVEAGPAAHHHPAVDDPEAIETTRIHRVAGLTGSHTVLVMTRPCRAPHHTSSDVGLIGGGHVPRPGEVSRAHHGVLFLDELPECRRHVLEVLRQPLEKGITRIPSPAPHRPRRAGCDRRAARDTNQIAGTMVVPDKDALA
jgi:hypothetical protein